jgi:hypothetical protein
VDTTESVTCFSLRRPEAKSALRERAASADAVVLRGAGLEGGRCRAVRRGPTVAGAGYSWEGRARAAADGCAWAGGARATTGKADDTPSQPRVKVSLEAKGRPRGQDA